jgi:hypothetical protein
MNVNAIYTSEEEPTLRREQLQWLFLDEYSRACHPEPRVTRISSALRRLSGKRTFRLNNYSNPAEATDRRLSG